MVPDTVTPPAPPTAQPEAPESFENYWGTQETHRYWLPDNKQYFDIKPMNEGQKAQFQKMTNRGLRLDQRTNNAHIDVDPANERHTLIRQSVIGWFIMQPNGDGTFSEFPCPPDEKRRKDSLSKLLESFNPKIVQDLEYFIRTKNPWMQADMSVEEIDEEITRLQELRKQVQEERSRDFTSESK